LNLRNMRQTTCDYMEKKYEKETHMIFKAIAPRIDELTICVRDGYYNNYTATALMMGLLQDIDKIMVRLKYGKIKCSTKKN
jgi:hypothetical protein